MAVRRGLFHPGQPDIPGQRHFRILVRRPVHGKGRTVLQRGQLLHTRHRLHGQGRQSLQKPRGVRKYDIRRTVHDRKRGLLNIRKNPGAGNSQTGFPEIHPRTRIIQNRCYLLRFAKGRRPSWVSLNDRINIVSYSPGTSSVNSFQQIIRRSQSSICQI